MLLSKKWTDVSTSKLYDTSIIPYRVFLTAHLLQVIYSQWIRQFALLVKVSLLLLGSKMQSSVPL